MATPFSILVLEIALALVIYATPRLRFAAVAILLWILPSFYSWLAGTFLEFSLVNDPFPNTRPARGSANGKT
jgi:uncharacterized membrane protein